VLGEERCIDVLAPAVVGMLLPDQGVARDGVQRVVVLLPQGTYRDELAE
jgi:hypothetical protein